MAVIASLKSTVLAGRHTQGGHQACRSDGRTVPVLLDAAFLALTFVLLLHGHSGTALRGLLLRRLRHTGNDDLRSFLQGQPGVSQEAEGWREILPRLQAALSTWIRAHPSGRGSSAV